MNHLFHTSFREMDAFRGRLVSEIIEMLFWAEKTECLFDVLGGSYVLDF